MILTLTEHVKQGKLSFKELEELLFSFSMDMFKNLMVEVLEFFDEKLMENRDKGRYQNKEIKGRTIQTLVGEVSFERRYYRDHEDNNWVYLLDEALGIEAEKSIGPGLLKLGVTWATKGPSYRDARDRLTDLYGAQVLSHEAIRQALLEVGTACKREMKNKIIREKGKRKVEVLFIEVDGFGARLQKNKKLERRNCRREAKMAVIHEGWAPRSKSKKSDYRLVNPHYISNLDESEDFWEFVRGFINAHYEDIDNILIVINGDGASWIREGVLYFAKSLYQYDRFHITRKVRSALRLEKQTMRKAKNALRKNDMGTLLYLVTDAWSSCIDGVQKKEIEELKDLLLRDYEYILDYRVRLKERGVKVPKDWRGLGASESNVNKFKGRTGKRGRAWSIEGLTAILTTLSRLFKGNLHESLTRTLDEREEWILDRITTGVGHVKAKAQSSFTGVKKAGFPASQQGTQGYAKLFRQISAIQFD